MAGFVSGNQEPVAWRLGNRAPPLLPSITNGFSITLKQGRLPDLPPEPRSPPGGPGTAGGCIYGWVNAIFEYLFAAFKGFAGANHVWLGQN